MVQRDNIEVMETVGRARKSVKLESSVISSIVAKERTLRERAREAIEEARLEKTKQDKDDYRKRRELQEQEKRVS